MTKTEFRDFSEKYKKTDEVFCVINFNISKTLAHFGGGGVMMEMAKQQIPYKLININRYSEYFIVEYDLETSFYFHYEDVTLFEQDKSDILTFPNKVKFNISDLPKDTFFSERKLHD